MSGPINYNNLKHPKIRLSTKGLNTKTMTSKLNTASKESHLTNKSIDKTLKIKHIRKNDTILKSPSDVKRYGNEFYQDIIKNLAYELFHEHKTIPEDQIKERLKEKLNADEYCASILQKSEERWKQNANIRKVYKELYDRSDLDDDESDTYVSLIIKSVFTNGKERTTSNAIWDSDDNEDDEDNHEDNEDNHEDNEDNHDFQEYSPNFRLMIRPLTIIV
ncbi:10066_t:CDS:2 [Funneliformis mosseae]|uniref:10066_t:CDS:1 n=1 Tax=Funneliformis mosseae TaxID=27381 RepID=A0A9N9DGQ9_FUNMO|nr:10066_t:CDS:2 [Funneliformis mosseae]